MSVTLQMIFDGESGSMIPYCSGSQGYEITIGIGQITGRGKSTVMQKYPFHEAWGRELSKEHPPMLKAAEERRQRTERGWRSMCTGIEIGNLCKNLLHNCHIRPGSGKRPLTSGYV